MVSRFTRLASGQRLLVMASWVARLASDEEVLASRAITEQGTGLQNFPSKIPIPTMFNPKID